MSVSANISVAQPIFATIKPVNINPSRRIELSFSVKVDDGKIHYKMNRQGLAGQGMIYTSSDSQVRVNNNKTSLDRWARFSKIPEISRFDQSRELIKKSDEIVRLANIQVLFQRPDFRKQNDALEAEKEKNSKSLEARKEQLEARNKQKNLPASVLSLVSQTQSQSSQEDNGVPRVIGDDFGEDDSIWGEAPQIIKSDGSNTNISANLTPSVSNLLPDEMPNVPSQETSLSQSQSSQEDNGVPRVMGDDFGDEQGIPRPVSDDFGI